MDSNKQSTIKVNKLQGEYLSSKINHVWTVDVTSIKQKYYFFFILDLASRRVVGYNVLNHDYTSTEATYVLYKTLKEENSIIPYKKVNFVHTDSGGIFLSEEWKECLKVNNIEPSSADSKKNQNQVSERFNRTFKRLLRDFLNKKLNKKDNKTNTFQLIGEGTKYNFENLKKLTEEIIFHYNSIKPHEHLHNLTPNAWANKARLLPEYEYIVEERQDSVILPNSLLDSPPDLLMNRISTLQKSTDIIVYNDKPQTILKNIVNLQKKSIIPFVPLSKNDNSYKAVLIRKFKNKVSSLEAIECVDNNKINLSKMDLSTQEKYQNICSDVDIWKETVLKDLEAIMFQNKLLMWNIKELKDKTNELKIQNEELLVMNQYLVETTEKNEEEKKLALERKEKRQKAKKLSKRDYIKTEEFYDIIFRFLLQSEDSRYVIARNRVAFLLMYFTGLRVSNLLELNVRNMKELMYDKLGTEVRIIKGGRVNQLIALGEDAQKMIVNDFFDDISLILKDKEDDYPLFTAESPISVCLHRVSLTRSLNQTLKYASKEYHKKISCHSFRATYITEGLKNNIPIHIMQKAVGHKNIQSTEHYIRHDLSELEWKRVITATNRERVNGFLIKNDEYKISNKKI